MTRQGPANAVSIVIPAYNCADTIAPAVESCLAQDHDNLEVIVVNDGSTDRTGAVLASFGGRIRVVDQRNGGLAAARNAGQRMATGEYVAWMDGDDLMAPGRIRLQAGVLATRPEIGLVSSDFSAFVTPETDVEASGVAGYYRAVSRLGGVARIYPDVVAAVPTERGAVAVRSGGVYKSLVWGNFVHPPTVLARRSLLDTAGFSDEGLRYSCDYDLILRMARHATFAYIDAPLLRYRRSDRQMSKAAGALVPLETARILERMKRDDPEVSARLKAAIRRRIAESHIQAAGAIGSTDRVRALGLLLQGLRSELLVRLAAFAFARIVVPPAVVRTVKRSLHALGAR